MYTFEYDPKKSEINLDKHGIDFEEAQSLWNDPDLVEIPANTSDEPRSLVIAIHKGKCWSAVITHRTPNVRIISVRRSRKNEVEFYESF
ncbi:BrnT family toxin [Thalassotalea sp. LPB0316]|uniref:BrnT family toxin n=1 Tax=Thalassotalea sp. LPB0316 TaxID=2769490 RepID=UPI001866DE7E|nr:BrnT family toxin [Thalassotalea sp. LPB0316]QOL26349.1 BrnT family toxin [Thalassotalea sp. LPB0316]